MCYSSNNHKSKCFVTTTVILAAVACLSCGKKNEDILFYNIDSLISAQTNYLTGAKAKLYKDAFVAGARDTFSYVPADTTAWNNELDIFRQLHVINKPVNQGSYMVDDGLMDPASNLTVKVFTNTGTLPVRSLRIFYQETIEKPRRIEAQYNEQNALYKSARFLSMEFQRINNKTVLTSYSIDGGQKMILADSVTFVIRGKIILD